jgi:hypothetical protein
METENVASESHVSVGWANEGNRELRREVVERVGPFSR